MAVAELTVTAIGDLLDADKPKMIGNNTCLKPYAGGGAVIECHGNAIAKVSANGSLPISACGWDTLSTVGRLRQIVARNYTGFSVNRKGGSTYLIGRDGKPVSAVSKGWLNVTKLATGETVSVA